MILVTNDDGVESAGIKGLAAALETLDSVYVVAPDRERSAIGMAITLHRPLRAKQVEDRFYAVDGTPVLRLVFVALAGHRNRDTPRSTLDRGIQQQLGNNPGNRRVAWVGGAFACAN